MNIIERVYIMPQKKNLANKYLNPYLHFFYTFEIYINSPFKSFFFQKEYISEKKILYTSKHEKLLRKQHLAFKNYIIGPYHTKKKLQTFIEKKLNNNFLYIKKIPRFLKTKKKIYVCLLNLTLVFN